MIVTAIEMLEYVCDFFGVLCPCAETSRDIIAGIQGACAGIGDPTGKKYLGDFGDFVQLSIPHDIGESWLESIRRFCAEMEPAETLTVIKSLISAWRDSSPKFMETMRLPTKKKNIFDSETFEIVEDVFRLPRHYVPSASTIREVLAFVSCYLKIKWPPHGSTPGMAELNRYICQRFNKSPVFPMEMVLLTAFANLPFDDACASILAIINGWRMSYKGTN